MSTPTVPPAAPAPACALGLTRVQVAAWHDGALTPDEARRLDVHVAGCPACAAHLAEFEQAERVVRAERVPEPDERLWRAVRTLHHSRTTGAASRRMLGGLGALAAVLLLAVGFARLFGALGARPGGTPTTTASAVPSPSLSPTATGTPATPAITTGPQLAWQAVTLPPGLSPESRNDALVASPVSGATAYACTIAQQGATFAAQVWQTHDAAQHWTLVTTPATGALGSCSLVLDATRPDVLVLGVGGQGAPPHSTAFYLTTDGGASWRTLATGLSIASLATDTRSGRHVYAVTAKTQQDGSATLRLQRSDDGGATWTPVDAGLLARHMTPQTVWLRPDTGELLVQTTDTAAAPYLFTSPDGGATWTELAGMRGGGYVVAAPQDGRTWQVCRISQPSPNANQIDGLDCYTDGNPQERFTPRPQLTLPGSANADNKPYYFALLPDGTLLAFSPEAAGYSSYTLYRLPPNAAAWENLGPVPEFPRSVGDTPGNVAILWAQPTFGMPPGQGVFVAQLRWS